MVGLCQAAFQALAGGTAATDTHRAVLWEQMEVLNGTVEGEGFWKRGRTDIRE